MHPEGPGWQQQTHSTQAPTYASPQPWAPPPPVPRKKTRLLLSTAVALLLLVGGATWFFALRGPSDGVAQSCRQLEAAQNKVNEAIWNRVNSETGPSLDAAVRIYFATYATDIQAAADAAAGSSLEESFSELRRFADGYANGAVPNVANSITTSNIAKELVAKCESEGVDMKILDTFTGRYV